MGVTGDPVYDAPSPLAPLDWACYGDDPPPPDEADRHRHGGARTTPDGWAFGQFRVGAASYHEAGPFFARHRRLAAFLAGVVDTVRSVSLWRP